jgi:hypothetical protein
MGLSLSVLNCASENIGLLQGPVNTDPKIDTTALSPSVTTVPGEGSGTTMNFDPASTINEVST